MYIKLTKFDNAPVWINAAFVVTVEPRRGGVGSIVVPIGDGLDYEVRESPADVLAMLEGAPVATVVPVPPPKSLTPTPDDVSAEPVTMGANDVFDMAASAESAADPEFTAPDDAAPAARKPAKKPARKPRAKKSAAVALAPDQIERLRKLAPRSLRKLANTLSSQFNLPDPDAAVAALVKEGALTLDHDHVIWS